MLRRQPKTNRWKGFIFGALGGIAGVITMRYYWKAVTALEGEDPRKKQVDRESPQPLDNISLLGQNHEQGESSTAALGRILYTWVTGQSPQSEETKTTLSYGIHWIISLATSGLYGAVQGKKRIPDVEGGTVLGTALWLLGDELLMPVIGLTGGPTAYPAELQAHSWGAHLAYGLASAAATQTLHELF